MGQTLEGGRVAGQADDEKARLHPVQIAVRKCLNLAEKRLAQIAGHPLSNLNGQEIIEDGDNRAEDRDDEHQQGRSNDDARIVAGDPLVDDPLDETGNGQVHDDEQNQAEKSGGGPLPIRTDKRYERKERAHVLRTRAETIAPGFSECQGIPAPDTPT